MTFLWQKVLSFLILLIITTDAKDAPIISAVLPQKEISATLGNSVIISCLSTDNQPLQSCRWERLPAVNGMRYLINVNRPSQGSPITSLSSRGALNCNNCSYKYSGIGLDKGDCSLTIKNVSDFHLAEWCCLLTGKRHETWIGHLNIKQDTVDAPYFDGSIREEGVVYNKSAPERTNVTCCAVRESSTMPVQLTMFLRNGTSILHLFHKDHNDTVYLKGNSTCRSTSYILLPEHNQQSLTCNATYMYHSDKKEISTSFPLDVKFGPVFENEKNITEYERGPNNIMKVRTTFRANPLPHMSWYLMEDSEKISFRIGPNHVKYKTGLYHIENDKYIAALNILNVTEEDNNRLFKLVVWNRYGSEVKFVEIVAPPTTDPNDTYWIFVLIGIGGVILFIFVITVVCVVLKKRDRRRGEYSPTQVTYSANTQVENSEQVTVIE